MKKDTRKVTVIAAIGAGVVAVGVALGKAFKSMKESAKAQHELDKANFAAAKAEARANFAEAKAMSRKDTREALAAEERAAQIAEANERIANAEARIKAAKKN